jgi:hypothetical protein
MTTRLRWVAAIVLVLVVGLRAIAGRAITTEGG